MRVIECNVCGATISADDDDELATRLGKHLEDEHEEEIDVDSIAVTIEEEAYEATDS